MTDSSKNQESDEDVSENYDGFYFVPMDNEEELNYKLAFFKFQDEYANSIPVDSGNTFHIAFFKQNEEGLPQFDDSFEAILTDPVVYINNLLGSDLSGCILRKTNKSEKWFAEYLDYITGGEFENKIRSYAKNLAEN